MAIRSPPRLDWAPGDSAIVSYRNRLVQLHDANGRAKRELASERIYDVRWRDDGQIVVLDDRGSLTFDRNGALVQQTHFRIDGARAARREHVGERRSLRRDRRAGAFAVQLEGERPERIWTLHARATGSASAIAVADVVGPRRDRDVARWPARRDRLSRQRPIVDRDRARHRSVLAALDVRRRGASAARRTPRSCSRSTTRARGSPTRCRIPGRAGA